MLFVRGDPIGDKGGRRKEDSNVGDDGPALLVLMLPRLETGDPGNGG